jgi:hypothetical protein
MTKRVILTGLAAGVAMYVWTFVAHMILPLGEAGVQQISNEAALLGSMQSTLAVNSGMFIFPSQDKGMSMQDYGKKLTSSPRGIIVYHPAGTSPSLAPLFITEFVTELVEAMLAVFLLSATRLTTISQRVGFVAVIGLIASIATNVSYWNWYEFPTAYTLSYIATQFIGFLVVGLIAASMLKEHSSATLAAAA